MTTEAASTPSFWGSNGVAGVLAASLAALTSIEFGVDTTLQIGAICSFLIPAPGLLLVRSAQVRRRASI